MFILVGVNRALTYILGREFQYLHKKRVEKTHKHFYSECHSAPVVGGKYINTTPLWQLLKDKAWLLCLNCKCEIKHLAFKSTN